MIPVGRRVRYHSDGTVSMDWYTFQKMPVNKIVDTIKANAKPVTLGTRLAQRCGFDRKATERRPVGEGHIREFV